MSDEKFTDERFTLTDEKAALAIDVLRQRLNRQLDASLEVCVRCGVCADSCHYYVANPKPEHVPAFHAEQLRKVYRKLFDPVAGAAPGWVGAAELDQEMVDTLIATAFGSCTMCGRCVINCPMGVDLATFNRMARGLLVSVGVMPEGVAVVSKDQWEVGNQMGVLKEDYLETLEWMAEELEEELGTPAA